MKDNHHPPSQENKYYEAVIHNSPAAIVVIDHDSHITEWNPAAEKLFGYTRDEAIGNNIDDLITNDAIRSEASVYSEKTKSGESIRLTTTRIRKDGTPVEVEVQGVPIYAEDGAEVTDYMAIYHDISELQQARKDALAASQAKSEFLANMSHEIRTPMNAILGFAELMSSEPLTDRQYEFMKTISDSGKQLLSIIDDILDFSKIEAGRLQTEMREFSLDDLLANIQRLMRPLAETKPIRLVLEPNTHFPMTVVSDEARIRQCLINLISNAIKFTETGQVVVRTQIDTEDASSAKLRFEVQDTGIGISADQMKHLFEPFRQGDGSTTRRFGGTGLGLAITRQLAELLGGRVSVTSVVGAGSTFVLELPIEYHRGHLTALSRTRSEKAQSALDGNQEKQVQR